MTAAAPEVRCVAASLPHALRTRNFAEAARLMSALRTERDKDELIFLLARCADRARLNAETGWITATPAEFHARFEWLRARGVDRAGMDPRVLAGESAYQRASKAVRRATRKESADAA